MVNCMLAINSAPRREPQEQQLAMLAVCPLPGAKGDKQRDRDTAILGSQIQGN